MRRLRAILAVGSTLCAFGLFTVVASPAQAATASLVNEPFTGTSASSSWVLPASTGGGTNDACLSAAGNTSSSAPIPGCTNSAGLQAGLQLTPPIQSQEGGVAYSSSVPSSLGLDVSFNTYQYGGTGADGIVFFLAASDPNDANASPVTLGPTGGSLGYSGTTAAPGGAGLTDAYLGFGLDVYGNYSSSGYGGSECGTSSGTKESLTVRGPGSGEAGYCISSTTPAGPLDTASAAQAVPVEIAINPTNSSLPDTNVPNGSVPANSYVVSITPVGASTPVTETALLPDASAYVTGSGWLNSNGVPQQLTFGWTAATGDSTDYHTVSNVVVQTLNGTPPVLTTGLTDNGGSNAQFGSTVTYTATPSVTQADETRPITLTDTFPAGLTPLTVGLGDVGGGTTWTCAVSGQTVTCTHAAANQSAPLAAVAMPVQVTASGSSPEPLSDTVTVGSPDAVQGSAIDNQTYYPVPTATALAFVTQPQDSQLNTAMQNADGSTTDIQVSATVGANGPVDPAYQGPVTLGFANNPGTASFVVNGSPVSTMTVNAVNGVADFSPVILNAVGFGYTLQATATGLTSATSNSFSVSQAATSCPSGQSCTVGTTSSTGQTASILAQSGTGDAVITATYGGNVAPIHPCTSSTASGILTFSGAREKVITLTLQTKLPVLLFCYGQPTPFLNILYQKTTYFNQANQDYEGLLPLCLPRMTGPCVKSIGFKKKVETVVILSGADDPHITIG